MPIIRNKILSTASRISFSESLNREEIDELANNHKVKTVQTSYQIEENTWKLINEYLLTRRPDIEIRVHGPMEIDLSFVKYLSNVEHLSVDYLRDVVNHEALCELEKIKSLNFGFFEIESFDFLKNINPNLESLLIQQTRSKKPKIDNIKRFKKLKKLYIEGHSKGVEVISELENLEELVLRSITTENLEFLNNLKNLWSLDIKLGGIRDLNAISNLRDLKYLELWQVRELKNIEVISRLHRLQYLFLQSLPNITKFPEVNSLKNLRRISIQNLKGLKDFSTLEFAPALKEFELSEASKQEPNDLIPLLKNENLELIEAWFGSIKKNENFKKMAEEYGKKNGIEKFIFK